MGRLGKVAARLGPSLLLLSVALLFSHVTLLQWLLPYRFLVVTGLASGAVLSLMGFQQSKRTDSRVGRGFLLTVGLLGLVLASIEYVAQYRAYDQRVVKFESDGAVLVGTLYRPHGEGPFPAMVLVHGSGKFPRRLYQLWADHFVRQGLVVLAYDKRGVGDSGGSYEGENNTSRRNIEQLADDASAAHRFLAARPEVKSTCVGFWGISQAGWIVPRAAVKTPNTAFMILVSGPVTTVGEENEYSRLTGDHDPGNGMTPKEAEERMAIQPPAGYDPVPDLRVLNAPGLWLQGDRDWSLPAIRSVTLLRALHDAGKPYEVRVFPGAGHAIFLRLQGHLFPELAHEYWETIDRWLQNTINECRAK
jgi:dienelactone hydrolase